MILRDYSFSDSYDNIVFDELLLQNAEQGQSDEVLRFWESTQTFVVLGLGGVLEDDVCLDAVRQDQIPIFRRCSGGGTVVQGAGCLNFSLVLNRKQHPALNDLRGSYRFILEQVQNVFSELGIGTKFEPICDLALCANNRKFSGNAQRRGKKFILHHGTILYDFKLDLISRYLKVPLNMPEYREKRTHADFVTNLDVNPAEFKKSMGQKFSVKAKYDDVTVDEVAQLQALKLKRQQKNFVFNL